MLQTSGTGDSIELLRDTAAALFVINLCASTTPVTLAHPDSAELKRFTFFVTRRREEGRERFRLHMGYFTTLDEAESMLAAVRDVYPAAWAGPAPESRAPAARSGARPPLAAVPSPQPVVQPAPAPSAALPRAAEPPQPAESTQSAQSPPRPLEITQPAMIDSPPVVAPPPVAPAVAVPVASPAVALEAMSNVREVLAELTDEPTAAAARSPVPKPAPKKPGAIAAVPARPVVKAPAVAAAPLTPAETLRVLETPASSSSVNKIRVLTPDDTQTLRDIRLDAQRNAPASFAVQLVWAVQPIDMQALPHLAIFDAYTLYHVEGSRQGRKWYGLRLGFFTDPGAAKQVAQYVRSEYASVAVVPVTAKEKDGAKAPTLSAAVIQQPAVTRNEAPKIPTVKPLEKPAPRAALEGFELLPDEPAAKKRDLEDAIPGAASPTPPRATGKAPGKRAVARPNRKPAPPGAPQPLESTLEILGASTLTIDESREIVNDAAARRPAPKKEKAGRFAKLLSRLSERG